MRTTPFYTRLAHVLFCLIALIYIAIIGETVIAPLLFGLLFALLLLPLARFLEFRLKFKRALATTVTLVCMSVLVLSVLFFLIGQLSDLSGDIPAFREQLLKATTSLQDWVSDTFHVDNSDQIAYVNQAADGALAKGTSLAGEALLSVSSIVLFLVFTFLYTFFILLYRRLLLRFIVALFAEEHVGIVNGAVAEIRFIVKRYVSGLLIQMAIVAALTCSAFGVFGIKYAMILGLVTGIFNVIPYIGIFVSLLLSLLVTFATGTSTDVLFVLIALFVIHLFDSNFVMPKIVGSQVKINPLAALLGLFVGEMIWGVKGMFLSIPMIAVLKVVFDRVDGLKPWGIFVGEEVVVEKPSPDE
ncbi:AI-2E family transporter [Flavobacterium sp.]|uniref:AI-2E family transporter n=1 Tax=Flavobacterium sp. TaxID=239 RepID=UPI001217F5A0|nr:AI-2E family transporter [Flavobacterium sp.]RZJ72957.1 MAG: AI-2E family transporter [Flavobacterium sp.]